METDQSPQKLEKDRKTRRGTTTSNTITRTLSTKNNRSGKPAPEHQHQVAVMTDSDQQPKAIGALQKQPPQKHLPPDIKQIRKRKGPPKLRARILRYDHIWITSVNPIPDEMRKCTYGSIESVAISNKVSELLQPNKETPNMRNMEHRNQGAISRTISTFHAPEKQLEEEHRCGACYEEFATPISLE